MGDKVYGWQSGFKVNRNSEWQGLWVAVAGFVDGCSRVNGEYKTVHEEMTLISKHK